MDRASSILLNYILKYVFFLKESVVHQAINKGALVGRAIYSTRSLNKLVKFNMGGRLPYRQVMSLCQGQYKLIFALPNLFVSRVVKLPLIC
jgi:hypothetical protein